MTVDFFKTLEALLAPAILCGCGAIAKCLKDIATELYGIKTAMAVTTHRVDGHDDVLAVHDTRIRTLETER